MWNILRIGVSNVVKEADCVEHIERIGVCNVAKEPDSVEHIEDCRWQ